MDATGWIAFWAAMFVITHLATTGASIRPRLVNALGAGPYLGVYSLVAFGTFIPLTIEFFRNKHSGPMLWYLRDIAPIRWTAIVLAALAIVMLVASFITPSPASMAPNAPKEPRGVLKITRHPLFVSIVLFAIAHLLMNGWLGDVLYFGTYIVVSVVGAFHQDQRKLAQLGEPYQRFSEKTSIIPGTALIAGRQRFTMPDIPIAALTVGAMLVIALLFAHPHIFGGHPLG